MFVTCHIMRHELSLGVNVDAIRMYNKMYA